MNSSLSPNVTEFTGPFWTVTPIVHIFTTVVAFVLNAIILSYYMWHRRLRSAFGVYLMALLAGNVFYSLTADPLSLISFLFTTWTIGTALCNMKLYVLWVVQALILYLHLLITLNRVWAMILPVSYRNHHSKKVALCIVFGTVVIVHVIGLPGVILEGVYWRKNVLEYGCFFNDTYLVIWERLVMIVLYDFPIMFPAMVYPFLWYRYRKLSAVHALNRLQSTFDQSRDGEQVQPAKSSRLSNSNRKKFVVLTVLTVSTAICWSPLEFYYTVTTFSDINSPVAYEVGEIMYAMEAILDPVYFFFTMEDLHDVVCKSFRRR